MMPSTLSTTRFRFSLSLPVPETEEAMLSGRVLKLAWYMAKREVRLRLTAAVSAGFTKKEEVLPVWITESFWSRLLAVTVQLRRGLRVRVRSTVTASLPETELVSYTVSAGLALETAMRMSLERLMVELLESAPTLPSSTE